MSPITLLPSPRRAPAWIALVTTGLCALGAVLWLGTRPDREPAHRPGAVTLPDSDPALAEARAARTAAMRARIDRMQERLDKLEAIEQPAPAAPAAAPSRPSPRPRPTARPATLDPEPPTPRVVIDPECLRNPLCKQGR